MSKLFTGKEWSFAKLEKTWKVIKDIGINKYGLDIYDTDFEVITDKQMIENYVSNGLPHYYKHWSFGKAYDILYNDYKKHPFSLAYEIVINTNPCICYLMEDNTMPMQALVMAHAAVGHNNFFKKNYLFKDNTQADYIREYMKYVDKFIAKCEELYSPREVMLILDAAHAIDQHSMLSNKPKKRDLDLNAHRKVWQNYLDSKRDDLDSLTHTSAALANNIRYDFIKREYGDDVLPEEDILFFIEQNSRELKEWQREILRIVRNISAYFYPQPGTQVMNEGWASYWHYTIIEDLWHQGHIDNESYMECKASHVGVVNAQAQSLSPRPNPYYVGFNFYKHIEKACKNPDKWDYKYLETIAGKSDDWLDIMKSAAYNYNDSDFIRQYSTPTIFKKLGLAVVEDDSNHTYYKVVGSHEPEHFINTREKFAQMYSSIEHTPKATVKSYNRKRNEIEIFITSYRDRGPVRRDVDVTTALIKYLWGGEVRIRYHIPNTIY